MNARLRRASIGTMNLSKIDLDTELDNLIQQIFQTLPEEDKKEIKCGDNLKNFNPAPFNNKTTLQDLPAYSLTVKKVIYGLLLFVRQNKLHHNLSESNLLWAAALHPVYVNNYLNPWLNALSDSWKIIIASSETYQLYWLINQFLQKMTINQGDKVADFIMDLNNDFDHFERNYIKKSEHLFKNIECAEFLIFKLNHYFDFLKQKINLTKDSTEEILYNPNSLYETLEQISEIVIQLIPWEPTWDEDPSQKEKNLAFIKEKINLLSEEILDLSLNKTQDIAEDLQQLFGKCIKIIKDISQPSQATKLPTTPQLIEHKTISSPILADDKKSDLKQMLPEIKPLITATSTIKDLFQKIDRLASPLLIKKQSAKEMVRDFLTKTNSLAQITELMKLLQQRNFLRRKRGILESCIPRYGDTGSFNFVLLKMQQRIRELATNSQEITTLGNKQRNDINFIMNYNKYFFQSRFDINDFDINRFTGKLMIKYTPNEAGFFQKSRIKKCQQALFTKIIQLLNKPNISKEEIRKIQYDFLQNDLMHLGAKIGIRKVKIGQRYSTHQGYLMNAILNDIIKYKEKSVSFECVDLIEKNYLVLQKIYSGTLPSLEIITQLRQIQCSYIHRLRKWNG